MKIGHFEHPSRARPFHSIFTTGSQNASRIRESLESHVVPCYGHARCIPGAANVVSSELGTYPQYFLAVQGAPSYNNRNALFFPRSLLNKRLAMRILPMITYPHGSFASRRGEYIMSAVSQKSQFSERI